MTDLAVSPEQVQAFHDYGYVIVNFDLDLAQLDAIVEKVHGLYSPEFHRNASAPARVQDAWKKIPEVRRLAVDSRIMQALEQLLKRKPQPFQTLNFPIGTRQLPHSDTIHFNCEPKGYMVGVWVALEDIDEANGPLIYYPGSHKLPEYTMQDFGLVASYDYYKDYEQAIQGLISEQKLEPAYGAIKKGEALIWHANLLHGGAPQKELHRSRHSQVTHYYFKGCKYYTPLLSTQGKIAYRNPEWIDNWSFIRSPWRDSKFRLRLKNLVRTLQREERET